MYVKLPCSFAGYRSSRADTHLHPPLATLVPPSHSTSRARRHVQQVLSVSAEGRRGISKSVCLFEPLEGGLTICRAGGEREGARRRRREQTPGDDQLQHPVEACPPPSAATTEDCRAIAFRISASPMICRWQEYLMTTMGFCNTISASTLTVFSLGDSQCSRA